MEKVCKKHGLTEFALRKGGRTRCKKCAVEQVTKRRRKVKELAVAYKGGKCEKCGYDKCVAAMDFHHLDPEKKEFNLSAKGHCRKWEDIKQELDKCILICSNCHRELHSEETT